MAWHQVTRRAAVGIAAGVLTTRQSRAADEARWGDFDLERPFDGVLAYGKMRADLSGAPAIWHHLIDMHAMIDGQVSVRLFRREGVSVHKLRVEADALVIHYLASTYSVDEDGRLMSRWTNPLTGEHVTFRALTGAMGPVVRVTVAGATNPTRTLTAPSAENFAVGRPHVWGDRVSVSDDMLVFRTAAEQKRVFGTRAGDADYTATELGAYEANLADVLDSRVSSAPSSRRMVGVVPWGSDLGMANLAGRLMIRHRARKMPSADALPAWLASRAEGDTPGILQGADLKI